MGDSYELKGGTGPGAATAGSPGQPIPLRITQDHVDARTPMGANLVVENGAVVGVTFRVWAPRATDVYVNGTFGGRAAWPGAEPSLRLEKDARGYWAGFLSGAAEGDQYQLYVRGPGGANHKRDPCARELTTPESHPGTFAYPNCNCVIRSADGYAWRSGAFHAPATRDLVVYELHVGTFSALDADGHDRRGTHGGQYLDVVDRIRHLRDLGVNAIELLPVHEFASPISRGYEGADLYSPEMDYAELDPAELDRYVQHLDALLPPGARAFTAAELGTSVDQLKALVDVCHLYGLAVILDVVYNHAGGAVTGQTGSLWFFDELSRGNPNDSLYFMDREHAGGPVFAFWNEDVRGFLANNARFFLEEYRVDGLRYDQVTVITEHGGWECAQALATRARDAVPGTAQIAEYWDPDRARAVIPPPEGLAFDAVWHDGLRDAVRAAIGAAAQGRDAHVPLDRVADALRTGVSGARDRARAVEYLESHDVVDVEHDDRKPRIPKLADGNDPRSWYATSRSRVAAGLLLTAPGVPMLFMGQELLEDKFWTDNDGAHPGNLVWWDGLDVDARMRDYLHFMRELVWLRRRLPALRSDAVDVFHVHEGNRVLAHHRWIEGEGRDVVAVFSLAEATFWSYALGFPRPGRWREVFNSDVYEGWVNPWTAGNGGAVEAGEPGLHGLPASARVVIPANGFVVFAHDA